MYWLVLCVLSDAVYQVSHSKPCPLNYTPYIMFFVARFVLAYWNTQSADIEWQIALSCVVPKLKNKTEAQYAVELIT